MKTSNPQRTAEIRRVIDEFLLARLDGKLDKVKDDDNAPEAAATKRRELRQRFDTTAWIADAASRAGHIQVVTHSIKPIHSKIKGGTNLYKPPSTLSANLLVGSHLLDVEFDADTAVDDAKHLDVNAFLKVIFEGRSLLSMMLADDTDLPAALSTDIKLAATWIDSFTSVTKPRGRAASHTLAKQLYWLTGDNPADNNCYHLLAPLFATTLAHRVHQTINTDRFSEASTDARQMRKDGLYTSHVLRDYPHLLVQKLGGENPQNVSHLNQVRQGKNYLLASLPPRWKSADLKPLLNTESMFQRFGRRPDVKAGVKALLGFLKSDPNANRPTRDRRDALVADLAGELLVFAAELRTLPPGWSQLPGCKLGDAERHWLDPDGVAAALVENGQALPSDTAELISQAFGRWLNHQLLDPLPMGDPEYAHWCALALAELEADEWEADHAA